MTLEDFLKSKGVNNYSSQEKVQKLTEQYMLSKGNSL